MKKNWLAAAMAAILTMTAACPVMAAESAAAAVETEGTTVRLAGLKGATTIGMVGLLDDAENGNTVNQYEFTLAGSADEITPLLLKGDLDMAAVPVNLGSVLYNKSEGAIEMLALNTLGVLYIVENGGDTVEEWSDLEGKTIIATGKGSTPEYTLRYLLSENGLDPDADVTMDWKNEPTETVSALATADEDTVAMLPQPYVTVAKGKLQGLRVALDLTESWDALDNGSRCITAGLVVRKAFAEEHPDAVEAFLEEYAASTEYVNENAAEASALVEKYGIIKAQVAEKAIPDLNIVCITGDEMKTDLEGYLQVLYEQNPKAIGGTMPKPDFYYGAN